MFCRRTMLEDFAREVVESLQQMLEDESTNHWVMVENGVRLHSIAAVGEWVEVVYERPECSYVLGLRVVVHAARGAGSEAARILVGNVNEPIGSFEQTLETDSSGVRWWRGEPAAWWDDRTAP